jgi:hypothetical protein
VPREWADLVIEGLALAAAHSRDQWLLGDLALEVEPMGEHGGSPRGALDRLERFAEEIDVSIASLKSYRDVADRWPPETRRLHSSWSAHQALAWHDARHELMAERRWTVVDARDHETVNAPERIGRRGGSDGRRRYPADVDCVAWADVDRALRVGLAGHPRMLRIVRRILMPVWGVDA